MKKAEIYVRCLHYQPSSTEGGGSFQSAKMLNFTIKWVQLIVGSSFPVILAQKILLPYPGVGVG